ncbi:hypothetical protein PENSUB_5534 [Penicillium subrubescens]|uniref:Uncharacterized protein n=1 Tax=Penicillium subrubescens TaxID=1316194 RepID=A0A1Q5U843_9EURO|nr:hypothetical protein PENSUB_5534 [Penicillium subrubescens]
MPDAALLFAIAMMTGGWDEAKGAHSPPLTDCHGEVVGNCCSPLRRTAIPPWDSGMAQCPDSMDGLSELPPGLPPAARLNEQRDDGDALRSGGDCKLK